MKYNQVCRMLLLISLLVIAYEGVKAQGWEKKYSPNMKMQVNSLFQLPDQSYWMSGNNLDGYRQQLMKIAPDGSVIWAKKYDSVSIYSFGIVTQDTGYLMITYATYDTINQPNKSERALLKLDKQGNKQWLKIIPNYTNWLHQGGIGNMGLDTTNNGGYIYSMDAFDSAAVTSAPYKTVRRTDSKGDTIWSHSYFDGDSNFYIGAIKNLKDGGFLLTVNGGTPANGGSRLVKIDSAGKILWQYIAPFTSASIAGKPARDGNILVNGGYYPNGSQNGAASYIAKLDQSGHQLWLKTYSGFIDSVGIGNVIENKDNTFTSLGARFFSDSQHMALIKVDSTGRILMQQRIPRNFRDPLLFAGAFTATADGGYIVGGVLPNEPNNYSSVLIKMDSLGKVYPHLLTGELFLDPNNNCVRYGSSEWLLKNSFLTFTNALDTFNVSTTDAGFYEVGLNDGSYQLQVTPIVHYTKLSDCDPTQVNISGADSSISLGVVPTSYGPYVQVDGYTRQHLCTPMTYQVKYCNNGTAPFSGVIAITFDSLATVDSSSTPWVFPHTGNTFNFRVDSLGVMDCASFSIYYHRACDPDLMGRTFCIDADVTADTVVTNPPAWDLSNLVVSATCDVDSGNVIFTLTNTGKGSTGTSGKLIVIEDNVISYKTLAQLAAGAQFIVKEKANGATWRLTVPQSPANPYSSFATAALEGCGTNIGGGISKHYYTQYPDNGYYAFHYSTCTEVVNAVDPNHKSVSPTGAGADHLVDNNTMLEYTIDFQNTGTDTALLVRVVDTLASYLDPATIQAGISSHPYEMELNDNHSLTFTFYNIYLPDSGHNQAGSNGFVKFRIKQKANNSGGTIINNDAAIYFDYNAPVITNTASVTVGTLLFSDIENLYTEKQLLINAYPNPFNTQAVIRIDGERFDQLQLTVYDINGKVVKQQYGNNTNQFTINRNGFSSGSYLFEIRSHDKMIGRGKLSVE